MGAVCGKGPAIVEGPDQLRSLSPEVGKQQLHMAVMAMEIMQVHHIGPDPLQMADHPLGRAPGIEAIVSQDPGAQRLEPDIAVIGTGDPQGIAVRPAAEQNMVFDALCPQQRADARADLSGTANAAGGIDLYDLHPIPSQKKW